MKEGVKSAKVIPRGLAAKSLLYDTALSGGCSSQGTEEA